MGYPYLEEQVNHHWKTHQQWIALYTNELGTGLQSPCVLTSNRVEEHTYHSSDTQPQTLQRGSMKKMRLNSPINFISIPMHTIWVTKKKSWKTQWSWKSLIWSLLIKLGLMNHMIGTLQLMAINCSGGTEVEGFALYWNRWINCRDLSLESSNAQVRGLWVKIRDQDNKGNLVTDI